MGSGGPKTMGYKYRVYGKRFGRIHALASENFLSLAITAKILWKDALGTGWVIWIEDETGAKVGVNKP